MKVVHVSLSYDPSIKSEQELLEQHYTVTGWAEALQRQGMEVTVINRYWKDAEILVNGVRHIFRKDHLPAVLSARHIPFKFLKTIAKLDADIIHLHNLTLSVQHFILRKLLPKKTRMVIQHHGGVLPGRKRRLLHNFFNRVADGFFFTTVEQGIEWFMNSRQAGKVMPVMEGATFFNFADRDRSKPFGYASREEARKITGITGSPVFLWVGRLDENKDPLTVLKGCEMLFGQFTDASLYMIYSDDRLAGKVKSKIDHSPVLTGRVHLVGKVDHDKIEAYYNSVDYFVLGSHYEGSGYALSEALRCGCIPIVTDIPSFRMMTNEGKLGVLWRPGDKNRFVDAANIALNKVKSAETAACLDFHKQHLSFDAIAATACGHYKSLME